MKNIFKDKIFQFKLPKKINFPINVIFSVFVCHTPLFLLRVISWTFVKESSKLTTHFEAYVTNVNIDNHY